MRFKIFVFVCGAMVLLGFSKPLFTFYAFINRFYIQNLFTVYVKTAAKNFAAAKLFTLCCF
ncbi:MAG TPA: hypothetical protein DEV87_02410 [Clostridiales bacterium]|nr:hypothetical protein [Clostridiales bacterium]